MTAGPSLPDHSPRPKEAPTALDGLLVVDFTRVVAGRPARKPWPILALKSSRSRIPRVGTIHEPTSMRKLPAKAPPISA